MKHNELKTILLEELCNEFSSSSGWIMPSGKYIELPPRETHPDFAMKYVMQNFRDEFKRWNGRSGSDFVTFFIIKSNCVRVSNFKNFEGPDPKALDDETWGRIIGAIEKIIKNCIAQKKDEEENNPNYIASQSAFTYEITDDGGRIFDNVFSRFMLALRRKENLPAMNKSFLAQFRENINK